MKRKLHSQVTSKRTSQEFSVKLDFVLSCVIYTLALSFRQDLTERLIRLWAY